jgi:RNA polymerase-interacting CarD/CdnL/TRCF family regulator
MDRANKREVVIALERRILRLLCSGELREPGSAGLLSDLASHTWRQAEHQIVWEALLRVPEGSVVLRQVLPTEAARMGFPDVEWSDYFSDSSRTLEAQKRHNALEAEKRGDASESLLTEGDANDVAALVRELKGLIEV